MASVTAAAGVLRSGHTEQKKKNAGKDLTTKKNIHIARNPEKQKEIRSPLIEKSNRVPQKNTAPIKPMEQRNVNPINKENVGPNVNKSLKPLTFSQSFLRTKTIKEKQQKDEKLKEVSMAATQKPVLGAYRGKIIQSKINSFRKPSDTTSTNTAATERKPITQTVPNKPKASATRKQLAKPSTAGDLKQKKAQIPPVTSQVRASTSVVSKRNTERLTMRRTERVTSQMKSSTTINENKAEHVTVRRTTHITTDTKTSTGAVTKRNIQHVTTRRTTNITGNQKSLENAVQQRANAAQAEMKKGSQSALGKKRVTIGPASSLSNPQEKKPVQQQLPGGKYPKANETAEERKARLAAWRVSKGRVAKRPLLSVAAPERVKEEEEPPVIKREPEELKEEPRQLFWATMAEEDEQEVFTLKVSHGFAECQKLIDQGIPKEEILTILEKQIEYIPEARKLSRYWECLARLEQRESQPYKVIEVCEEAVAAGAQPLEELKTILADTLEQLKTCPEESQENEAVETKAEIKSELEDLSDTNQKKKRGRRRAMKLEHKSPSSPEKASKEQGTPEKEATSSVVRFSVCTTPHLERMRRQLKEGDSAIKGYKFLTPVRRSSRLERKSHAFPEMLKDHDPCIAGIAQLEDLEEPEGCPNAYIFRKNEALKEVTAGSLAEK